MKYLSWILCILLISGHPPVQEHSAWIRVNQLGYKTDGPKNAIWCSKEKGELKEFSIVDIITAQTVFTGTAGKAFGPYGPFEQTYRLDFTKFTIEGRFVIRAGGISSPEFTIASDVYRGAADFCLKYMRQQRSGFNPFLKDSCHTHDGYVLYGSKAGIKDSTHIDVSGGWHDASDYLQYASTSANATYHLLAAFRDFPRQFGDNYQANGLFGKNGQADVLDEAEWGLKWLSKMHPRPDWLFNQLGDDRDHAGMRIPKQDSFYGKGLERPVYFASGEKQQRGKFMNDTHGAASIAGKFSSAFSLGAMVFNNKDQLYVRDLMAKARSALAYGDKKPGNHQTASVMAPYIYAEDNWVDDMELGYASYNKMLSKMVASKDNPYLRKSFSFAQKEPITPWLGKDTANHYQWYPFINIGHYELAKQSVGVREEQLVEYYRKGIQLVWEKAKTNAFYRGIPYIWCSNNLTTSFAIQCYWYRELSGDNRYLELEQACFDWLFGVNPWGTSMVYGLPSWGDTPVDPHSAFTHLKKYPIDGGLIDGPVYTSIYKNLIGIQLYNPDSYAPFQSSLAVYHDDYGDYSTNEPTMDGTASLIYLLAAKEAEKNTIKK